MMSLISGQDLSMNSYEAPQRTRINSGELARQVAAQQYERVTRRSTSVVVSALIRRDSNKLTDLQIALCDFKVESQHFIGQVDAPIAAIKGSESRAGEFDSRFRPLRAYNRERWISVAVAWELGLAMPPIELIQIDHNYYVRDGHRRISVARAYGQTHIPALVTIWDTGAARHYPSRATAQPALPFAN